MTLSQRLRRPQEHSTGQSTSWNRLPAGIALRHIRVIAGRIGAVVPSLRGVRLAVIVILIKAQPGKSEPSTKENPVIVEPATVEPATVEPAPVKATAVKATAATVETSGVGGIWLAQRRNAQHSRLRLLESFLSGSGVCVRLTVSSTTPFEPAACHASVNADAVFTPSMCGLAAQIRPHICFIGN